MRRTAKNNMLSSEPSTETPDSFGIGVIQAAQDPSPVSGLTHEFYRYPARFSPVFVRAVIEEFSAPGDLVLDPFAGGGTSLVEAVALGRHAIGIDISTLSQFVCEAKTALPSDQDVAAFVRWSERLPNTIHMHRPGYRFDSYADAGYYRNLEGSSFWRLRKAIEQTLASVELLRLPVAKLLARAVVLKTGQWALDSRKRRPSIPQFRERMREHAAQILAGALALRERVGVHGGFAPKIEIINRSVEGAEAESVFQGHPAPKLIVTSPPYPGIHVLYHRWQVDGRREAPAPFWIAGKLDGAGSSYYTMGDRKSRTSEAYFAKLATAFSSISAIAGPETTIVQMVAFSEAEWQLPRYLQVMEDCGLSEEKPWRIEDEDGRLWRQVPNRKWHAHQKARSPGAREVVLVHRKTNIEDMRTDGDAYAPL